jgi:K+-sensing histidine kinase KdpD
VDPLRARALLRTTATGIAALGGATALVALLQHGLGVPNPSAAYILAVAVVALVGGRVAVLVAAVAAFLLHDLLSVDPRLTLAVADPGEWLNLVLLLTVGLLVGQMAALLRIREETAVAREREALTLSRPRP